MGKFKAAWIIVSAFVGAVISFILSRFFGKGQNNSGTSATDNRIKAASDRVADMVRSVDAGSEKLAGTLETGKALADRSRKLLVGENKKP